MYVPTLIPHGMQKRPAFSAAVPLPNFPPFVFHHGVGKLARTANLTTDIAGEEIEPTDWLLQLGRPVVS